MLPISRRHSHFVFGVVQSGLTCLIAAAIASLPVVTFGDYLKHWLLSWLFAWAAMLPVVLLAAPAIRRLANAITRDD